MDQWPDDPPLVCEANFPYDLTPHQTDVVIGDDRLFGSFRARSDLGDPLLCDMVWAFRCRAHETPSCDATGRSNTITASTLPCNPGRNCTHTQGLFDEPSQRLPLQNLTLGTVSYGESPLLQILNSASARQRPYYPGVPANCRETKHTPGADPADAAQTIARC